MDGDKKVPPTEFRFGIMVARFSTTNVLNWLFNRGCPAGFSNSKNRCNYSQIISLWDNWKDGRVGRLYLTWNQAYCKVPWVRILLLPRLPTRMVNVLKLLRNRPVKKWGSNWKESPQLNLLTLWIVKWNGPFDYRLGRQVFILERGVRFPYGLLTVLLWRR
jgi:hypothetical protein